ncbi:hypothetical protein [Nannocystis punicea]|uniref:Uncharacterized protein n=1 Tax=Nannocystis punicea TaxID=2995304 RepID=A0ABY7H1T9_9BACT|nr:hypothetical protein [Nannocystis poenicansa]WAS92994.1 hypothetical protein O0S08_43055 [Nannocystis poenicansa]
MREARSACGDIPEELFWVDGGPGAGALRRLGVAPLRGRAVAGVVRVVLFAWLPLLVLSAAEGVLVGGAALPFLHDLTTHVRFLVAVPLLLLAELPIGARLDRCTAQFIAADLVRVEDRSLFAGVLVAARRARDSRVAAFIVLAAAYLTTAGVMSLAGGQAEDTWHFQSATPRLTLAGRWFALVSLPLFHFLLYRWFHRLFVWGRFLRRVSRLDLQLTATHPDRAGGLGFLGDNHLPFGILVFAANAVVAGAIATRILFAGATLERYHSSYLAALILGLLSVVGPLCVVVPTLLRVKLRGLLKYGVLGSRYCQQFEAKWLDPSRPADEPLLGTSDVQSLADLAASHARIRALRLVPLEARDVLALVLFGVLPALPLAATTSAFRQFLQRALRLFL